MVPGMRNGREGDHRRSAPHRDGQRLRTGRGGQGERAAPADQLRHRPGAVQHAVHLHRRPGLGRQGLHRQLDLPGRRGGGRWTRRIRQRSASSRRRAPPARCRLPMAPRSAASPRPTSSRRPNGSPSPRRTAAAARCVTAYEKGIIWGNDNYRTIGALVNIGAGHRQHRPRRRWRLPSGRPPGRLLSARRTPMSAALRPTSTSC